MITHADYTDGRTLIVGVGELGIAEAPTILVTQALGSCVGVALWDSLARMGGLAHVMLPLREDSVMDGHPMRFASDAVPGLIARLNEAGVPRRRMVAKIAGGAAMFKGDSPIASIGQRNVDEVRRRLVLLGVPIVAEDTGGSHARTVELHLDTGILLVRSYLYGMREL